MISLPFDPWTSYALLILSEIFIFIVIALDTRLLKPLKLRFTIWFGPVISMYILASIFLSVFLALEVFSISAIENYAVFLLSAIVGVVIGTAIGRRIPVTTYADGTTWFTGGRGLVAALLILLVPRAVEQAIVLVPAIIAQGSIASVLNGFWVWQELSTITGSLVFVGTFLSIGWRWQVQARKRSAPPPSVRPVPSSRPRTR
jgi:hypothetical protein